MSQAKVNAFYMALSLGRALQPWSSGVGAVQPSAHDKGDEVWLILNQEVPATYVAEIRVTCGFVAQAVQHRAADENICLAHPQQIGCGESPRDGGLSVCPETDTAEGRRSMMPDRCDIR